MIGGMEVEAMPDRGWKRAFDEPIPLPRGRALVTLEDAADYIRRLPATVRKRQEWADGYPDLDRRRRGPQLS